MRVRALISVLAMGITLATAPAAQELRRLPSPILTVDQEALFSRSEYGARLTAELEAAGEALRAESRQKDAELAEEERLLTERRSDMDPEAFRELAIAFDAKAVQMRAAQEEKLRELTRRRDEARQQFYRAVVPVLADLVQERGAVAILDSSAILISAQSIDITSEAIRRIDEKLGDGSEGDLVPDEPETRP